MPVPVIAVKDLREMRRYVDSGATRSYEFRKNMLEALRDAILKHEDAIYDALYKDLRKSREEAYATEVGIVLMEIRVLLKNLRKWTRPKTVRTNLLNFPSRSKIIRDPLGVVMIIAPWNYPVNLTLLPLAGALAAGNAVMVKPSELAPATAEVLERIIRDTYSRRYVSIVLGEGKETIQPMMEQFRFDHIFYTGSTEVGYRIYQLAAEKLVPVTLELGGKNPAVIERDADLKVAARRIALGKFLNAGQTCVAPDYLLLHISIREAFLQQLSAAIRDFFGDDASLSPNYGRIINWRRFDRLVQMLDAEEPFLGGRHDRRRLYIEPTVLEEVDKDGVLMQEEIFGPILPVFTFESMEEAMGLIKANPSPLAFYVFTRNALLEKKWLHSVRFGGGCVNNTLWHLANYHLPFGGVGDSGMGAYHGRHSVERFTHAKPVLKSPVWFDPSIKYPPFEGKLKWLKKMIR
jgi:aldehyde dehydrogenase (NAD+)